jgi:hypothetical protein
VFQSFRLSMTWLHTWFGLVLGYVLMVAFFFFVEKRKRLHAEQGLGGARWVDALAVTAITGMLAATAAILVANRLLPDDLAHRAEWDKGVFWVAWLAAFAHAVWRTAPVREGKLAPAWVEQCWAVATLATAAVALNWITTGDHLLRTVGAEYWPVAGFDLALLVSAALSVFAARRLLARSRKLSHAKHKADPRSGVPDSARA